MGPRHCAPLAREGERSPTNIPWTLSLRRHGLAMEPLPAHPLWVAEVNAAATQRRVGAALLGRRCGRLPTYAALAAQARHDVLDALAGLAISPGPRLPARG